MLVVVPLLTSVAAAQALRLVDADGVVHVTNLPTDPRYRGVAGGSANTQDSFRRSAREPRQYTELIREISHQHDVDPTLVAAVIQAESAFDPTALSSKGAAGLMQLMPQTASALGVLDRFDPHENIRGGVRHLRYLLDRYRGRVALALAADNAGEGALDAHGGIVPYRETEQYVQRVLRLSGLAVSLVQRTQMLHRYPGPDAVMTYSNLPPDHPGRGVGR
jgi:soluble lytic murein transglycosylase-like protein